MTCSFILLNLSSSDDLLRMGPLTLSYKGREKGKRGGGLTLPEDIVQLMIGRRGRDMFFHGLTTGKVLL